MRFLTQLYYHKSNSTRICHPLILIVYNSIKWLKHLEERSSIMEDKTKWFDDIVDRMKGVFIVTGKKEEAKAKSEEDIILEDLSKSLIKEELKVQKMKI